MRTPLNYVNHYMSHWVLQMTVQKAAGLLQWWENRGERKPGVLTRAALTFLEENWSYVYFPKILRGHERNRVLKNYIGVCTHWRLEENTGLPRAQRNWVNEKEEKCGGQKKEVQTQGKMLALETRRRHLWKKPPARGETMIQKIKVIKYYTG